MKKCVVIYNPNSGKGLKNNIFIKFERILNDYGYEVNIIRSKYKKHIVEIVEQLQNPDLVISIGGDGTFNEAMTGNINRKNRLVMAHLPVGTTNDIGTMYGYGRNIYRNLELLLNGCIKKIDLCKINNRLFTYSAGIGKFTAVSHKTPTRLKKKFGYLAYLMEGLKDLTFDNVPLYGLTYEVNGDTYKGKYSFLLISNANRIAGINNFYKGIKLDDNTFEVLFCDITDKKQILKSLYYITTRDITKVPGFKFYRTNKLKIAFDQDSMKEWTIDGEGYYDDKHDFNIEVIRNVRIMIPKKNIDNLFINNEKSERL